MMNDNMMAKAICRAMTILTTVRFIGEKWVSQNNHPITHIIVTRHPSDLCCNSFYHKYCPVVNNKQSITSQHEVSPRYRHWRSPRRFSRRSFLRSIVLLWIQSCWRFCFEQCWSHHGIHPVVSNGLAACIDFRSYLVMLMTNTLLPVVLSQWNFQRTMEKDEGARSEEKAGQKPRSYWNHILQIPNFRRMAKGRWY